LALSIPLLAQPKPVDCAKSAVHRQFDFWVGEWAVTDAGSKTPVGSSKVSSILKGCAVLEEWTGMQGGNGKSLNFVNLATGKWEQQWTMDTGNSAHFIGGLMGKAMVIEGENVTPAGKTNRSRMTFTPQADGSVRQMGEISNDGGKSWTKSFDFIYQRR
jgi:hypothetical protein